MATSSALALPLCAELAAATATAFGESTRARSPMASPVFVEASAYTPVPDSEEVFPTTPCAPVPEAEPLTPTPPEAIPTTP